MYKIPQRNHNEPFCVANWQAWFLDEFQFEDKFMFSESNFLSVVPSTKRMQS